ncbi:MAG: hypothetical protein ACOH1T_09035 [Microbacteriaceae bacterium]
MESTQIVVQNTGWWFALALVNAGLAENKGRGRWVWFALSLFIGPLATAMIVVWAPVVAHPEPVATTSEP